MGVSFSCAKSRLRINKEQHGAALLALQTKRAFYGAYWTDRLLQATTLIEALQMLVCKCTLSPSGDIETFEPDPDVDTDGHDEFTWLFPILAPFIASGSYFVSWYDDQEIRTDFRRGRMRESIVSGGDEDEDSSGADQDDDSGRPPGLDEETPPDWPTIWPTLFLEAGSADANVSDCHNASGAYEWHPESDVGHLLNFVEGKLHGRQSFFQSTGAVLATIEYQYGSAHGCFRLFAPDETLAATASFVNGKQDGELRILAEDGSTVGVVHAVAGRYHGRQIFLEKGVGTPRVIGDFDHGVPHGVFYFRQPDGRVVLDIELVHGKLASREDGAEWSSSEIKRKLGAVRFIEKSFNILDRPGARYYDPSALLSRWRLGQQQSKDIGSR